MDPQPGRKLRLFALVLLVVSIFVIVGCVYLITQGFASGYLTGIGAVCSIATAIVLLRAAKAARRND